MRADPKALGGAPAFAPRARGPRGIAPRIISRPSLPAPPPQALEPSYLEPHCAALAKALQPTLAHQHSRVRAAATEALVALLLLEPSALPELAPQLALIASDRTPTVREQAVHSTTQLLARMPQRHQHSARLLPLLLGALSDEAPRPRAPSPRPLRQPSPPALHACSPRDLPRLRPSHSSPSSPSTASATSSPPPPPATAPPPRPPRPSRPT